MTKAMPRSVCLPNRLRESVQGRKRASAYTEIALERNAGGTPLVYEADVKDKESLLQSVKSFLEMKEGKKAILGNNGLLMLKIISCLYELGISIPEDVGIAGFDELRMV